MHIRAVNVKTVLNKTGIPGYAYCLNPYVGCQHACKYCYATFITERFRPHAEKWGEFVDVKINAPDVLMKELPKARKGIVYLSSVTDPYQPVERKYGLTRKCLELLWSHQFPVSIQTKSPLVLRDLDLIRKFEDIQVGMTVTTDDEHIRKLFEPGAPPILVRISTLQKLRAEGIRTYAFIAPILPLNPKKLMDLLKEEVVDCILVDKMNYPGRIRWLYRKHHLERYLEETYFLDMARTIQELGNKRGIEVQILF